MKKSVLLLALALGLSPSLQAQFSPGNLAILRVGDGVETLGNSGNSIFLDQYSPSGTLINTVAIPDSGPNALIISGKATSEGFINRSPDKQLITIAGYNTNLTFVGSLSGVSSSVVPRAIATVDYLGNYNFITNTTTYFNSNNIRSAVTDGTNNFWAAGPTDGTVYLGLAAPATGIENVNTEVVSIFAGNLYFSSQKTTPIGVYGFSGTPVTASAATLLFATTGPSSPSPYAFAISPDTNTAYVADDNSITKKGGIQKYTNTLGTWSLVYTLGTGAGSTVGARALAVDFTSSPPVIYATTADATANRIITITDAGSTSVATVLATSGANELFRGIQFIPEGSAPNITTQPQDQSVPAGQSASFTVVATGTAPLAYQWQFGTTPIPDATNATFTIDDVDPTNAGPYQVVITNTWGSVTSIVAMLYVSSSEPPPRILTDPQSQTNNAGTTVNFFVSASGDDLSYQWQKDGTNLTDGGNISGSTTTNLTLAAVFAADAGSYTVIVSNSTLTVTSAPAILVVNDPYISAQPTGQTYLQGATATLSVQAIGTMPLFYQWLFDSQPVADATNNVFQISNLQPVNSGAYSVIVSNSAGSVLSSNAFITVALPQTTFFHTNLVVLRLGDGAETLTNSGNSLFLDQFTFSGALLTTMPIPDNGSNSLLISGTSTSDGYMTLSANSNLLVVAGYNTNLLSLTTSLSASAASAVPRVVGQIDGTGAFSIAVSTTTEFSAAHFRSAASDGESNFWGAGSADGIYYFGLEQDPATIENTITDCRVVNLLDDGYLAFSTQSGTPGIYIFNDPLPMTSSGPALAIGTGHNSTPEDFVFASGNTLAYVADDSSAGGVQCWQLSGGNWTLAYTLGSGVPAIGARSLTVDFTGTNPVIYAVTAETANNRLISISDTGAGSSAVTLATAGPNELFRSVKFAPVFAPSAATLSAPSVATNAQFTFTVSGSAGYTYVIQSSTDLINWTSIQTNTAPFVSTNSESLDAPAEFFRALLVP